MVSHSFSFSTRKLKKIFQFHVFCLKEVLIAFACPERHHCLPHLAFWTGDQVGAPKDCHEFFGLWFQVCVNLWLCVKAGSFVSRFCKIDWRHWRLVLNMIRYPKDRILMDLKLSEKYQRAGQLWSWWSSEQRTWFCIWRMLSLPWHVLVSAKRGKMESNGYIRCDNKTPFLSFLLFWRTIQLMHPIVYRVLYIPGGAGILPSTVSRGVGLSWSTVWEQYKDRMRSSVGKLAMNGWWICTRKIQPSLFAMFEFHRKESSETWSFVLHMVRASCFCVLKASTGFSAVVVCGTPTLWAWKTGRIPRSSLEVPDAFL